MFFLDFFEFFIVFFVELSDSVIVLLEVNKVLVSEVLNNALVLDELVILGPERVFFWDAEVDVELVEEGEDVVRDKIDVVGVADGVEVEDDNHSELEG